MANKNSLQYSAGAIPSDAKDLPRYINSELNKLQAALQNISDGHLDVSNTAPAKPRDGDFKFADGVNWNPGQGAGFYYYNNGSWLPMGAGSAPRISGFLLMGA